MYMALTVPAVPTGMKAGVRIPPRGMAISPRRARPSVGKTWKAKRRRGHGRGSGRAKQQAGIAIGIEAIAGGDRMRVGGAHGVEAAKTPPPA